MGRLYRPYLGTIENVRDTEALDNYEATYGPIADPSPSNRQPRRRGIM